MAKGEQSRLRRAFLKFRDSGRMKDFLVFLIFVGIAVVFWFIMALNDDAQQSYDVNFRITDVPDSITFINLPPHRLHITVRDRGSNLLRNTISGDPALYVKFSEYADGNRFRLSHNTLSAMLRHVFGSTATISSVSPDSLNLVYTDLPGKRLPVQLEYDITAAAGMVLGKPKMSTNAVDVFSNTKNDTLRKLQTEKVVMRNLDKTVTLEVPVTAKPGTRVEPSKVSVTFPVEQLVKKESDVLVEADNLPIGYDILFFPSRVKVSYYVPMSRYNDPIDKIKLQASFNEAYRAKTDKVGVKIVSKPSYISNLELLQDSVEYTIVKGK